MAEAKCMVAGFNHNVKHAGKLYHVQTEDSGVANPRIATHLFIGGNIIASKTTSYADMLGADDVAATVRALMQAQHKEMMRNLVKGVYDEVDAAHEEVARAYQPGQLAIPEPSTAGDPAPEPTAARTAAPSAPPPARAVTAPAAAPAPRGPARVVPPPLPAARRRGTITSPIPLPAPPARPALAHEDMPALTPPPVLRREAASPPSGDRSAPVHSRTSPSPGK